MSHFLVFLKRISTKNVGSFNKTVAVWKVCSQTCYSIELRNNINANMFSVNKNQKED
jgi:hypothetical protein